MRKQFQSCQRIYQHSKCIAIHATKLLTHINTFIRAYHYHYYKLTNIEAPGIQGTTDGYTYTVL